MEKEQLINQTILTKTGLRLKILSAEGEGLDNLIIKTSDKRIFNLLLAYQNGFIRFEEQSLNEPFQKCLEAKEAEKERIRKAEEENRKQAAERKRLEEERLADAIDSFRGEYAFLSNFHDCPVTYQGYTYPNNEAAFQAQKDLSRSGEFTSLNPTMAKRLGRKVKLRPDWEKVKVGIMAEIVRSKFTQHPDLKEKLLATGDRLLVEGNTWNDTFWGICRGKGQNHLGKILMKIREELRGE